MLVPLFLPQTATPAALTAKLVSSGLLGCPSYSTICTSLNALATGYLSALKKATKYGDNSTASAFATVATHCDNLAISGGSGRRLRDATSVANAQSLYRTYDDQSYATVGGNLALHAYLPVSE